MSTLFRWGWDFGGCSNTLDIKLANKIRPYPIMDDPMTALRKFELLQKEKITHECYLLFTADDSLLSTIEIGHFASETAIRDSLTIRFKLQV